MAVVAKGKQRRSEREEDAQLEKLAKVRERPAEGVTDSRVRAIEVRSVVEETMARVYAELFPSKQTHDENGTVDVEIKEEAYIVTLFMFVGNNAYQPRRGLKIREAEISDTAKFCKEHR